MFVVHWLNCVARLTVRELRSACPRSRGHVRCMRQAHNRRSSVVTDDFATELWPTTAVAGGNITPFLSLGGIKPNLKISAELSSRRSRKECPSAWWPPLCSRCRCVQAKPPIGNQTPRREARAPLVLVDSPFACPRSARCIAVTVCVSMHAFNVRTLHMFVPSRAHDETCRMQHICCLAAHTLQCSELCRAMHCWLRSLATGTWRCLTYRACPPTHHRPTLYTG
jgi:hypothetical protein